MFIPPYRYQQTSLPSAQELIAYHTLLLSFDIVLGSFRSHGTQHARGMGTRVLNQRIEHRGLLAEQSSGRIEFLELACRHGQNSVREDDGV
mmetsp:Transcript_3526/g.6006  ORF Transcript_3526/g.6006 Transcript_3526/m.6006 type:complete len:91 (-) Transcript_3526:4158-4430(-)